MSEAQAKAQFMHEGTSDVQPVHRSPKEAAVSNQFDSLPQAPGINVDPKGMAESNQFGPDSKISQDWVD